MQGGGTGTEAGVLSEVWRGEADADAKERRVIFRFFLTSLATAAAASMGWRASDFQMGVLAVNLINRKILIDAVPGISPHTSFGSHLSRTC